ncbi:MAG: hypothetical protein LBO70_08580 [Clostridiales Family XIII bacterium]|jgi:hypothetical protein|nr:hypothetical protein [Clostridiales Family XIII bacterium]
MANETINGTGLAVKQKSPTLELFAKIPDRVRILILILAIIGAACAYYFLLLSPGLDKLEALESEAVSAEEQQTEYNAVIERGIGAEEQIAQAIAAYDETKNRFFTPMVTETLDSTVTGHLVKSGFDPQNLSVSKITPEEVTPFTPPPLSGTPEAEAPAEGAVSAGKSEVHTASSTDRDDPVALPWDGGFVMTVYAADEPEGAEGIEGVMPFDESGSGELGEEAVPDSGAQSAGSVYSYTVNVTANGGWNNLYKFADRINKLDGVEIIQYSFSNDVDGEVSATKKGAFTMTIKLYVFVETEVTAEEAPPADEIPADAGEIPGEMPIE